MRDSADIAHFIQVNSFGVLISTVDGQPFATHLPFLYDDRRNLLLAHMARANPQWRNLHGQSVLVVFQGPHAYISPSWYGQTASVPTWNYMDVHVYGACSVIDREEELAELLEETVRFHEPESDLPSHADQPFYRNMMKAVVGFRIDISKIEGKTKLSQNKPVEIQRRVIAKLGKSGEAGAQSLAQLMQERLGASI